MFLMRKVRLLLAFLATVLMWVFHERLWLKLRPRYFAELTVPNLVPNELPAEAVSASTVDAFKTSLPTALHYMYIDVFNCTYSSFGCCFPVGMRRQSDTDFVLGL
jgi:hypothetical protein